MIVLIDQSTATEVEQKKLDFTTFKFDQLKLKFLALKLFNPATKSKTEILNISARLSYKIYL